MKAWKSACVLFAAMFWIVAPLAAQTENERAAATERTARAAKVLDEIMASPDSEIPTDLLENAHAIAVIPNVVKGAFIVGGRFGKGLLSTRNGAKGWNSPVFVDIGGGSVGYQIGVEATDLILVFTRPDGARGLLEDNLKISAEAGAAAGPVGRHVGAGTNVTFDAPIYTYSRSQGVFAGVSLEGTVVGVDETANREVYGENVEVSQLVDGKVPANDIVRPLIEALKRHAPTPPTE